MLRQTHFVPPVPLIVAQQLGLLSEAGVELQLTETRGSDEQLRQLAALEQDLAVTAMDNIFEWARREPALRIVAQVEATTPLVLVARPPMRHISDLEGCTFGVDALGNGFVLAARYVLDAAGVDVRWKEVGGVRERMQALLAGEVDASLLGPPFDGPALARGLNLVASLNEMVPGYPGQVLVASERLIRTRRGELIAYLNVLQEAVRRQDTVSEDEGRALLTAAGYAPAAAAALWAGRARTLRVDLEGLGVVRAIRQHAGPHPILAPDGLVDDSLVEGSSA